MSEYNAAQRVIQYTIVLDPVNQEFSLNIPADTRVLKMRARQSADVRFAFIQNKVATPLEPYHTLKSGVEYNLYDINPDNLTIYFATGTAGTIVELECWIKG